MVTLPPTLSNQLCHSLNAVRVKGGTTGKCDAGDTSITGCKQAQLLELRSHFST